MFMDSTQWMQETGVEKSIAEVAVANVAYTRQIIERKARPQKDQAINCPRCLSTNTKFCYYNNYSLTQPRYFCKACRRYWTEGGTLRNVPVGGGSRKNKRSSISTSPSLTISTTSSNPLQSHKLSDLNPKMNHDHPFSSDQNPKIHHDHQGQDLNLGFPTPHVFHHHSGIPQFFEFPNVFETRDVMKTSSSSNSSSTSAPSLSALNLLRTGIGLNSFIPMVPGSLDQTNAIFASSFPFNQECKPALGFSFDGVNDSRLYANPNLSRENNTNGNPFGSTKQHQNESDLGKLGQENSNGYWNGMLGGGGSW